MDYLSFFLSVLISQISIHFYLGDFHNLGLRRDSISFSRNSRVKESTFIELDTSNKFDLAEKVATKLSDDKVILTRNLKHLEFINYLENHLYNEAHENMSVDFLNEFNTIKQDVQLKTIEASKRLS